MAAETHPATRTEEYNYAAFGRSMAAGLGGGFRDGVRVGEAAPEFALTALDGATVRLSDLRGQYVVLEFGSIT
jgi:hypothetical protein